MEKENVELQKKLNGPPNRIVHDMLDYDHSLEKFQRPNFSYDESPYPELQKLMRERQKIYEKTGKYLYDLDEVKSMLENEEAAE